MRFLSLTGYISAGTCHFTLKKKIFFSKVCGIGSSGEQSDGPSGHETVLLTLSDGGYEVRFARVCPTQCGVPMTRNRYHYQAILRCSVVDACGQMDRLDQAWQAMIGGKYGAYTLDELLEETPEPKAFVDQNIARPDDKDRKWKTHHQEVFERYQALCLFKSHFLPSDSVSSSHFFHPYRISGLFCLLIDGTIYIQHTESKAPI